MEPTIETGSLALINTRNLHVEKGNIIAFERGEITVVHRAIRETAEGWITKEFDNNACEDPGIVNRESIREFNRFMAAKSRVYFGSVQTV